MRRYPLKPGEGERAGAPLEGSHWIAFWYRVFMTGVRVALDEALFKFLYVVLAIPRGIVRVFPQLREPRDAYWAAVRGHALSEWPGRLRDERRRRLERRLTNH